MKKHNYNFYYTNIKRAFPDATNIRKPKITGWGSDAIFIIDTQNKTNICKFNHKNIILHNKYISDILNKNNISVPKTTVHNFDQTWFETYEYRPEKTLHELIIDGLSDQHIFLAYKSALEIQYKISQIDLSQIYNQKHPRYVDIIKYYDTMPTYIKLVYTASALGKQYLLHNDIHPKNILYSPESEQAYLIDLDSIAISNFDMPSLSFLRNYPLRNYDELSVAYKCITREKFNTLYIKILNKAINMPGAIKSRLSNFLFRHR